MTIADIPDAGSGKIPLWLFGFLYLTRMRIGGHVKAMRNTIPYEKVRQLPMFSGVDDCVISSLFEDTAAKLKRYGKQETVFVA